MTRQAIIIDRAVSKKPRDDGRLTDDLLTSERRSKKVGMLPIKARMVLNATNRCLDPDLVAGLSAHDRVGVSLGTFFGSMDVAEVCLLTVRDHGFRDVTPSWYATGLPNATAAIVASVHGMQGPNLTALGYQAGVEAIIMGCRQILAGRASAMLAGGFDVPSERVASRLREAPEFADARAIHPGVGLVWLSTRAEASPRAPRIIGWSQALTGEASLTTSQASRLVASAAEGSTLNPAPAIHIICPGRKGTVDHLAATAPMHLVENIIETGPPGIHALIVKGFTPWATCLLIEKPLGGS